MGEVVTRIGKTLWAGSEKALREALVVYGSIAGLGITTIIVVTIASWLYSLRR